MTAEDKLDLIARAICRERCAFMGDPPCFNLTEDDEAGTPLPWPNPHCDEPGCHAEASAALSALRAAGWLLIPPLDTEEGREAVEKMLSTWFDDESVEIISAALRAAGGA